MEYVINELDKSVPVKLKENLQNLTRRMDRIRNNTDVGRLVYRSKDYEYVAKALLDNMASVAGALEPLTLGTVGTQKPYRFGFEQYVQEARTKMPSRQAADACMMQMLLTVLDGQTDQSDTCELSPECSQQLITGSALAFQQTTRIRAAVLARHFDCLDAMDLPAHIYKLCIQVYKEAKSLEAWDHPPGTRTLFMQQINYCATQGYGEFIKPRWMNKILAWQEGRGCYVDERQPFMRLTGFVGPASGGATNPDRQEEYKLKKAAESAGGTCNSLASAMALGSLVVYVRALLESDQAFQYDILE